MMHAVGVVPRHAGLEPADADQIFCQPLIVHPIVLSLCFPALKIYLHLSRDFSRRQAPTTSTHTQIDVILCY